MSDHTCVLKLPDEDLAITLDVDRLLRMEEASGRSLLEIYNLVAGAMPRPDVLDGRVLTPDQVERLADGERSRLTLRDGAAGRVPVGPWAILLGAMLEIPPAAVLKRLGFRRVIELGVAAAVPFASAVNALLLEEPLAGKEDVLPGPPTG